MKVFFTPYPYLPQYKKSAIKELNSEMKKRGFIKKIGQFGGGPELEEIVIAWFSMHPILGGIAIGVLANRIDKLLTFFFNWHKKNKLNDQDRFIPKINITIYSNSNAENSSQKIEFKIDREYNRSEIISIIKTVYKDKSS